MAMKMVCDRCGKAVRLQAFIPGASLLLKFGFNVSKRYDLCEDCLKEFREFILKPDQTETHEIRTETHECVNQRIQSVETMSCAECKHRPIGAEICEEPCHYEPSADCQWK